MTKNPLKNVDILDQVNVQVFMVPVSKHEVDMHVAIDPLDNTKNVVIDSHAKKELEGMLLEQARKMKLNPVHPNTKTYLSEFASRAVREYAALGLVELEDVLDKD